MQLAALRITDIWVRAIPFICEEQHPRGAEREKRVAGAHHPYSDSARSIVSATSNHWHAWHAPSLCKFRPEFTGHITSLM
jgi:hypothetical protein